MPTIRDPRGTPARRALALLAACLPFGLALLIALLEILDQWKLRQAVTAGLTQGADMSWSAALYLGAPLALWAWGALVALACTLAPRALGLLGRSPAERRELRRQLRIAALSVWLGAPIGLLPAYVDFSVLIGLWSLCWLFPTGLALKALLQRNVRAAWSGWLVPGLGVLLALAGLGLGAWLGLGGLGLRSAERIELVAEGPPMGMAWSPDGRSVLLAEFSGQVRCYELGTGRAEACAGEVPTAGFLRSSDSAGFLTAELTPQGTGLWVTADGLHASWKPHGDRPALAVAVRPDGKILATGGDDNVIRLWSPRSERLRTLFGHSDTVRALAWSPDGKRLASASADGSLRVWDLP